MPHPEADTPIREQGLHRATDLMRACEAEAGFLATPTDTDNYRRVWGRDSSIISIAAAATGDRELLAAAARTFETLHDHQGWSAAAAVIARLVVSTASTVTTPRVFSRASRTSCPKPRRGSAML